MAFISVVTGILSPICGGIPDLREDPKLNLYSSLSHLNADSFSDSFQTGTEK